jgi:hypothetical protein
MKSLKMLWDNYGIGSILILFFALYIIYLLYNYVSNKSSYGSEMMSSQMNQAYSNQPSRGGPYPSNPRGQNEVFSSANGVQSSMVPMNGQCSSPNCSNPNATNPADLLPISSPNSQWSELNPSGKGELSNINFLKAGHHIGIDTIGQSLRNANLQLRSEPPNPQMSVGPWNQSTITADFIRPPLEIGEGSQ